MAKVTKIAMNIYSFYSSLKMIYGYFFLSIMFLVGCNSATTDQPNQLLSLPTLVPTISVNDTEIILQTTPNIPPTWTPFSSSEDVDMPSSPVMPMATTSINTNLYIEGVGLQQTQPVYFSSDEANKTVPENLLPELFYFGGGGCLGYASFCDMFCRSSSKLGDIQGRVSYNQGIGFVVNLCGFYLNETIQMIVVDPYGNQSSIYEPIGSAPLTILSTGQKTLGVVFLYNLDIDAPLGTYTIQLKREGYSTIIFNTEVVAYTGPPQVHYYSQYKDGEPINNEYSFYTYDYIKIIGFPPSQKIRVTKYQLKDEYCLFDSWIEYDTNEQGMLKVIISNEDTDGTYLIFSHKNGIELWTPIGCQTTHPYLNP